MSVVAPLPSLVENWEAAYERTGQPIVVDFRAIASGGVVPERYTHLIHSYPAKLLPQIPFFFLSQANIPRKAVVADPFCGSGTVLLEAAVRKHRVIGADVNPLARLITRVKLTPLPAETIRQCGDEITRSFPTVKDAEVPRVVNIAKWYSPRVTVGLATLRALIRRIEHVPLREFMQVCLSACARRLSFADPQLSVPVLINVANKTRYGTHYAQLLAHLEKIDKADVLEVFNGIVRSNTSRISSISEICAADRPIVLDDGISLCENIDNGSVDLIITSPPYVGAQKYIRASSLSLGWLDMAYEGQLRPLERRTVGREHFAKVEIGTIGSVGLPAADDLLIQIREINATRAHIAWTYLSEMERAMRSMFEVLRSGGGVVLVTGPNTVCGFRFDTPSFLEQMAHRVGFRTKCTLIDHIRSRGLMTKRNKTAGVIASEWVLCLEKA